MSTLTLAEFRAARYDDDELVAIIRRRLVAARARDAVEALDRLSMAERRVLVALERKAIASLPVVDAMDFKKKGAA